MAKGKKQKIIIGIMLIIFVIGGAVVLCVLKMNHNKSIQESMQDEEGMLLEQTQKEEIERFANYIVDQHPVEGHAMIVIESELISHDEYERYLVEVDTVAINEGHSTDLYTYYVVIQKDQEDEFYVMPFGIEVIKGDKDHLQREIMISMMKVVNGWGNSAEEFQDRWSKALVIPKMRAPMMDNNKTNNQIDLDKIYYTQAILKYMNDYLSSYKDAIEHNDFTYIRPFLSEDEGYSAKQREELRDCQTQDIKREATRLQVVGMTLADDEEECLVITQVDMNTYLPDKIVKSSDRVTYKVGWLDEEVKILDVLDILDILETQ